MKTKIIALIIFSLTTIIGMTGTSHAEDYVTMANLNVRTGPSIDDTIAETVPNGTVLDVVEHGKDWSKIKRNDKEYYVASRYIRKKGEEHLTFVGNMMITHYCTCSKCCGKNGGKVTYSGTVPTVGRSVAVAKSQFPMGTVLYIDGYGYRIAEDTGSGVGRNHIDVFVGDNHELAKSLGTVYRDVYIQE